MMVADQQLWLAAAGRRRDEPFDDADRGLLQALAAVGSGALSNAELYQQVRFERERLSSITLNIGEGVCAVDADGKLTFVNRAAADMIELPSLGITIDSPMSDGALTAPDFLLVPASEAMRTGRTDPRGRRPVPRQERQYHPGRLHGLRGDERRHAVGRGDRLPRHHRAQSVRGRAPPSRLL